MPKTQEKTLPAKTEEAKVWEVTYKSAGGLEVKLTPNIVKRYLVHGNSQLVTDSELVYFINICRARGLNPLVKDAYLIKYSEDPASIVTSIDFFRKRAKAQPDCEGWNKGIIVETKEGVIKDSAGLLLENEKLLGGWFEAKPKGWNKPFRHEVNLKGFIKRKRDGTITQFWKEENQPAQIAKVAESQGLRAVWPDEFEKLYTEEEIGGGAIDVESDKGQARSFDELLKERFPEGPPDGFDEFLKETSKGNDIGIEQLKAEAARKFSEFMVYFEKWKVKKPALSQVPPNGEIKEEVKGQGETEVKVPVEETPKTRTEKPEGQEGISPAQVSALIAIRKKVGSKFDRELLDVTGGMMVTDFNVLTKKEAMTLIKSLQ
jgi:phage recombination protein Bet